MPSILVKKDFLYLISIKMLSEGLATHSKKNNP